MRAVVAGVDDDGVVGDAHVVQRLEQRADRVVVLDHAVDVLAVAVRVAAAMLGADVRAQMHARRVEPDEERLARCLLPLHVVDGRRRGLVVDRLHALLGQRAGVLDGLLADLAEARIDGGIVPVGGLAAQNAARAEFGAIGRVLGIVRQLGLFLGVEVIEVAEELIEAVHGRQRLVAIADVVLAELAGGVAEVLHHAADRGIELAHAHRRAGEAHLGEAGADAMLAGQERGATCRARLLAVVVQELDALAADAVDVGRLVAHQAVRIGADVRNADIVAEDDEDVGLASRWGCLLRLCRRWKSRSGQSRRHHQGTAAQQQIAALQRHCAFCSLLRAVVSWHSSASFPTALFCDLSLAERAEAHQQARQRGATAVPWFPRLLHLRAD